MYGEDDVDLWSYLFGPEQLWRKKIFEQSKTAETFKTVEIVKIAETCETGGMDTPIMSYS